MAGAAARAERVGDIGRSSPENWIGQLASPNLHVLLFLFAQAEEVLEQVTTQLRAMYSGSAAELSVHDARSLPESKAHFGYRDGFAQPTIEGGLPPAIPDVLPRAPAGEFVLGHPSQYADFTYPVPIPPALGENGSFAAFRILAQDCDGFEQFLTEAAIQTGLDRELIAASSSVVGETACHCPFRRTPRASKFSRKIVTASTTCQATAYRMHSMTGVATAVPWDRISVA